MLIPNPDLDFLKFWPQNPFLANLGLKSQSCPFCLKIDTHGISEMLILIPTLVFWISNPNFPFWANMAQKIQSCLLCLKIGTHGISRMLILIPTLVFWIWNPNFLLGKFGPNKSKLSVLTENWQACYLEDTGSYSNISFINFQF